MTTKLMTVFFLSLILLTHGAQAATMPYHHAAKAYAISFEEEEQEQGTNGEEEQETNNEEEQGTESEEEQGAESEEE